MADTEPTVFRKEDLYMLLDTYKNQVESNKTLMEQQGKLLDQHNSILTKQAEVVGSLNEVLDKLGTCHDGLKDKLTEYRTESLKEHNGIRHRIYVAYAGMTTIILSLIGLLYNEYSKVSSMKEATNLLKILAKHFGLGVN